MSLAASDRSHIRKQIRLRAAVPKKPLVIGVSNAEDLKPIVARAGDNWRNISSEFPAVVSKWAKLYNLSRSATSTGPVLFKRPARYTRAYSRRRRDPPACSGAPGNEWMLWVQRRSGPAHRQASEARRGPSALGPPTCLTSSLVHDDCFYQQQTASPSLPAMFAQAADVLC